MRPIQLHTIMFKCDGNGKCLVVSTLDFYVSIQIRDTPRLIYVTNMFHSPHVKWITQNQKGGLNGMAQMMCMCVRYKHFAIVSNESTNQSNLFRQTTAKHWIRRWKLFNPKMLVFASRNAARKITSLTGTCQSHRHLSCLQANDLVESHIHIAVYGPSNTC